MNSTTPTINNTIYCPIDWDGIYCWPNVAAGTMQSVKCPSYIDGFDSNATRNCKESIEKQIDYTLCILQHEINITNETMLEMHLEKIQLMSKIGYSSSLVTLVVAFNILAFLRKLRCPRNYLHMHLFVSFIMRALIVLLRYNLYKPTDHISVNNNITADEGIRQFEENTNTLDCKVFISFWHYFLMANYCWILMEGLYLHNLVFTSVFSDSSNIRRYVILGWGLPILSIVPWVIVRATLDDFLCWAISSGYFWIIRGPITASILLNFFFFMNVTRVLFTKIFSFHSSETNTDLYRKWFKSTLILVPLFGVHYSIFLILSFIAQVSLKVEIIWLYVDQLFSSTQGCVVAFLYCFLNEEVQTEVRKLWKRKWTVLTVGSHHSKVTNFIKPQPITGLIYEKEKKFNTIKLFR